MLRCITDACREKLDLQVLEMCLQVLAYANFTVVIVHLRSLHDNLAFKIDKINIKWNYSTINYKVKHLLRRANHFTTIINSCIASYWNLRRLLLMRNLSLLLLHLVLNSPGPVNNYFLIANSSRAIFLHLNFSI